jgi:hypothetical protein
MSVFRRKPSTSASDMEALLVTVRNGDYGLGNRIDEVERSLGDMERALLKAIDQIGKPKVRGMDQLARSHKKGTLQGSVLTGEQIGDMAVRVARLERKVARTGKRGKR